MEVKAARGSNGNKQDNQSDASDVVPRETRVGLTSNYGSNIHLTEGLESSNGEMSPDQKKAMDKQNWIHLANILDRIFFGVQFLLVLLAVVTLFPASPLSG